LFYLFVRYYLFNASFSKWIGVFYGAVLVLDLFMVYMLGSWAETVDLSDPGLIEFMRDAVYFSWIILFFALFTDYAYLLLLVIPGYGFWKVSGAIPSGMGGGGADEGGQAKRVKKPATKLSKSEKRDRLGVEYRGGKPKFGR
jgi:hypothetical protein